MTWAYIQKTGELLHDDVSVAFGYSGKGEGKNNPAMQDKHNIGPIPCGVYRIGDPVDTVEHGPMFLPLRPSAENRMFGRGGFGIHGDSIAHPGTASEGCVIQARTIREQIVASKDREFHVLAFKIEVV